MSGEREDESLVEAVPTASSHHTPAQPALKAHPGTAFIAFMQQWWPAAVATLVVLGAYVDTKSDVRELRNDIRTIKEWLKEPGRFPAASARTSDTHAIPSVAPSSAPRTSAEPPPVPVVSSSMFQSSPQSPDEAVQHDYIGREDGFWLKAAMAPPVCVERREKVRFPCEQAIKCYKDGTFKEPFVDELKSATGLNRFLICDAPRDAKGHPGPEFPSHAPGEGP